MINRIPKAIIDIKLNTPFNNKLIIMLIPSTGMDNKNDNIFSIKIALNAKRISSGIMNTYATKRFKIMKNIAVSPVITVSSTNIT